MTPLDRLTFLQQLQRFQPDVSRETWEAGIDRLEIYAKLLQKWQKAINLVGPATIPDLWRRHMLDSAQLLSLMPALAPESERGIVDLGSGAGFPGLVLAALREYRVQLIDSDVRKCAFLREAAQAMGIHGRVAIYAKRFEAVTPWISPVITARACAPLPELLTWASPFADESTVFLLLKGARVDEELTAADKHWTMVVERQASIAESDQAQAGIILKLTHVKRRTKAS